jgi:hypothetical protein
LSNNKSPSNINPLTDINNNDLNNICCPDAGLNTNKDLKDLINSHAEIIIVKEHLCNTCPRLYTDIFKTILIVCNHLSHKNDRYSKDIKVDNTIRHLMEEEVGFVTSSEDYIKSKKKLRSIYYLNPTVEDIAICIKLMHKALEDELGTLCNQEILEKIVNDVAELGISKEQVYQLLQMEIVN